MSFSLSIHQITRCIEALRGIADHHLRLIAWKHIQKDEYLSQVVLRPGRADRADRSAHDRHGVSHSTRCLRTVSMPNQSRFSTHPG
jgi:hypothetical protein